MIVLLNVFVPGTPRPKGSMRHVGNGRMVEQVNNRDWFALVVDAAHQAIRCPCDDGSCAAFQPGYPVTAPTGVEITLYLPAPAKPKHSVPAGRNTGDADKHARLILDALQAAGVIKDDAAVVDLRVSKRYGGRVGPTGAAIAVTTHPETTAGARRHEVPPSPEEPAPAVPAVTT